MEATGSHCILELYDCPSGPLNDVSFVEAALREAVDQGMATLLNEVLHKFHPQGVTALGLIAESHVAIHTWPEFGYVAADVFTCGNSASAEKACLYLVRAFKAGRHTLTKLIRGTQVDAPATAEGSKLQACNAPSACTPMPGSKVAADFWIHEYITPWEFHAHGITNVLAYKKTAFQEMYIVESGPYGKALVLDGKWQSCTGDEFLYHEPLVHPAMLLHGSPRTVLILGGGEGATAREVLRWNSVKRAVMIDIDGEVVAACREHLVEMHQSCFDDERLEVLIEDALGVLDTSAEKWDVIISDLSDPIEEGPSFKLFTKEYFERARAVLAPDGVFVVQAGPVSPAELGMHARLVRTVNAVFEHVHSYSSFVPSYAAPWGFAVCRAKPIDPRPDPAQVDHRLAQCTTGGLRMLDGAALLGMFQQPAHIRRAIAEETQVYTLAEPPKFFGKGVVGKDATDKAPTTT